MLKVTIELHPFGDATSKKTLHDIYIANMGSRGGNFANYYAWLDRDPKGQGGNHLATPDVTLAHNRCDGALTLVHRTIEKLLGKNP